MEDEPGIVDGMIIRKWVLKKYGVKLCATGFDCLRAGANCGLL
jgi:hypothetical protein